MALANAEQLQQVAADEDVAACRGQLARCKKRRAVAEVRAALKKLGRQSSADEDKDRVRKLLISKSVLACNLSPADRKIAFELKRASREKAAEDAAFLENAGAAWFGDILVHNGDDGDAASAVLKPGPVDDSASAAVEPEEDLVFDEDGLCV